MVTLPDLPTSPAHPSPPQPRLVVKFYWNVARLIRCRWLLFALQRPSRVEMEPGWTAQPKVAALCLLPEKRCSRPGLGRFPASDASPFFVISERQAGKDISISLVFLLISELTLWEFGALSRSTSQTGFSP